jgi:hypothetical protein
MNRFSINPLFSKSLLVSIVFTLAWAIFMRYETKPFTPEEIVRFEFAGTPEGVTVILRMEQEGLGALGQAQHLSRFHFHFSLYSHAGFELPHCSIAYRKN